MVLVGDGLFAKECESDWFQREHVIDNIAEHLTLRHYVG